MYNRKKSYNNYITSKITPGHFLGSFKVSVEAIYPELNSSLVKYSEPVQFELIKLCVYVKDECATESSEVRKTNWINRSARLDIAINGLPLR